MTLLVLIAINIVVSLAGFRALSPDDPRRAEPFLFIPNQVARGENGLGMLLAHFAHGGFGHLLFNMFALYSFGVPVLAALVLGGAAAVATKSGFLKAFGKLIVVGVIGLGSAVAAFFRRFRRS